MIAHQAIKNMRASYDFEMSKPDAKEGKDNPPNAYVAMRQRMGMKQKS